MSEKKAVSDAREASSADREASSPEKSVGIAEGAAVGIAVFGTVP